ncbi:hypothetical protein TNCT_677681 [Trichonephila clavata]|uniref:Uncharacterized protein n=1 Tax=Trichonephila clavata TaxID=2740835 RepID=A0A8X6L903_TRICU|nr:hypothetical protein TNCT_677681 [Trichonephila clavata]
MVNILTMDKDATKLIVEPAEVTPLLSTKTTDASAVSKDANVINKSTCVENISTENKYASWPSYKETFGCQSSGQRQPSRISRRLPFYFTRNSTFLRMSNYCEAILVSSIRSMEPSRRPMSPVVQCAAPCFICSILPPFLSSIVYRLHFALLSWPLSVGILGALSIFKCPGFQFLPIMMTIIGFLGFATLFLRIATILILHISAYPTYPIGCVIKCLELLFFILFVAKNGVTYFYEHSSDPSSKNYCDEDFYNAALMLNTFSTVVVVLWILTYIKSGIQHVLCNKTF